jgi:hypothetical protein
MTDARNTYAQALALAARLTEHIPAGTPGSVLAATLAQMVAAFATTGTNGSKDEALERLATLNVMIEKIVIAECEARGRR